jgi:hypothetical protein
VLGSVSLPPNTNTRLTKTKQVILRPSLDPGLLALSLTYVRAFCAAGCREGSSSTCVC